MIRLNITRTKENPSYKPDARYSDEPSYLEIGTMNVEITEEQFEAIRKEVLKTF